MAEDAFISTLKGERIEVFWPRQVFNKPEGYWEAVERGELVLCACVETPGSAREYRPLAQFERLPPLDQIPLYAPCKKKHGKCKYK